MMFKNIRYGGFRTGWMATSTKLVARGVLTFASLCAWFPASACLGEESLVEFAKRADFGTVSQMLASRPNTQISQPDGMTALHWAVYHDHAETVRQLLELKAEPNVKNRYGIAPLTLACQNGNPEIVDLLLKAGADPHTEASGGETALMTAARTGRLEPVTLLLKAGAEVDAQERKQQTALMWAAAEGHVEVVDALLQAGADAETDLRSGFNALFFAVREGKTAVTNRLLEAGLDVNLVMQSRQRSKFVRDQLKSTPLLIAIENGHFELAENLLKRGADPNLAPSGYAPLHAMSWVRKPIRGDGDPSPRGSGSHSSLDMVRILKKFGAEVDSRVTQGKSGTGRFHFTGATAFLLASQTSDLPLMKLLLELGADPTIPNNVGSSPLLAAAGVGALGDGDESAGTEREAIAAVEFLLKLGADIDGVDKNGETAMHGAAYQSLPRLVQVLQKHGANVEVWNRKNRAGWTPRLIALGFRPGNFRPAPETIDAIEKAMRAAGVELPPVPERKDLRKWGN